VKFWLHISQKEQLRRFRARDRDPLKRWKLTGEDWRNLSKRSEYERAVADMLRETDHDHAPWRLIAAENKPYARVAVLREVIEAYEQGMRDSGHEPVDVGAALQSQRFAADRLGSPQPRRLLRPQKLFKQESRRHRPTGTKEQWALASAGQTTRRQRRGWFDRWSRREASVSKARSQKQSRANFRLSDTIRLRMLAGGVGRTLRRGDLYVDGLRSERVAGSFVDPAPESVVGS
jgi:hypothetical protein